MASSTAVAYQFMPWARRGLTVALTTPDTLGAGALLPARATRAGRRHARRRQRRHADRIRCR